MQNPGIFSSIIFITRHRTPLVRDETIRFGSEEAKMHSNVKNKYSHILYAS
jgi:hypothetical protein